MWFDSCLDFCPSCYPSLFLWLNYSLSALKKWRFSSFSFRVFVSSLRSAWTTFTWFFLFFRYQVKCHKLREVFLYLLSRRSPTLKFCFPSLDICYFSYSTSHSLWVSCLPMCLIAYFVFHQFLIVCHWNPTACHIRLLINNFWMNGWTYYFLEEVIIHFQNL